MLKDDNNGDNKNGLTYTITTFAIIFFIVVLAINIAPIAAFITNIFNLLAPIILGAAIAYLLNPILKFLEFIVFKKIKSNNLTRVLSLILTYVYALLVITLIFAVLGPRLINSIIDLGKNYKYYLNETMASVNSFISTLSINFDNFDADQAKAISNEILSESWDIFDTIINYALNYLNSLLTTTKNVILGLFVSIYILVSKERLYAQSTKAARAFMSSKMFQACMRYIRIANSTFGRFFVGKLFDSAIVFALTLFILAILKIPHSLFIAMVVGILNIIPFLGILVAIIFSAFLVFIAAPEKLLIFIIVMIIIEQIDANIISPKVLGSSAGISSLGVLIAVTIMGSYFGIVGMIIGVPIFAIIIAIFKEWLEKRLKSKQLPINTTEYYADPDYSSESEEYKSISRMIAEPILKTISKKLNNTITDKLNDVDNSEETDQTDGDNQDANY